MTRVGDRVSAVGCFCTAQSLGIVVIDGISEIWPEHNFLEVGIVSYSQPGPVELTSDVVVGQRRTAVGQYRAGHVLDDIGIEIVVVNLSC